MSELNIIGYFQYVYDVYSLVMASKQKRMKMPKLKKVVYYIATQKRTNKESLVEYTTIKSMK
jgi:hypothetical protein